MSTEAEDFTVEADGETTIRFGLPVLEDLVNILSSYGEYASDKLDTMSQWPGEYAPEDFSHLFALRQTSLDLYRVVIKAFSEAVATTVYGPEDEAEAEEDDALNDPRWIAWASEEDSRNAEIHAILTDAGVPTDDRGDLFGRIKSLEQREPHPAWVPDADAKTEGVNARDYPGPPCLRPASGGNWCGWCENCTAATKWAALQAEAAEDARTESERLRDAADSEDGGEVFQVLVESTGLIPEPYLFRTGAELKQHVVDRLMEQGVEGFIWQTVQGAGGTEEEMDTLAAMLDVEGGALACAELLVKRYLGGSGGCIFNDSGDEFRWFEEKVQP